MKRILLLALAAALAVAGGVCWQRSRRAAAEQIVQINEFREHDRFVERVLDTKISFAGGPLSLQEFADDLARQCGVTVIIDEENVRADDISRMKPVSQGFAIPPGVFTVQTALELLLPDDLSADFRGRQMVITTREASLDRRRLRTAVYPLPQPEPGGLGEEDWADLVETNLERSLEMYARDLPHIEIVPGALVVVDTAARQREVRQFIDRFAQIASDQESGAALFPSANYQRRRRLELLKEPASCEVAEMPLADVVRWLSRRHRVPIILRSDKLAEAGVEPRTPISKSLSGVTLQSLLRLMLKDLELTYFLHDEALVITTPEDAEERLVVVAYDVGEIMQAASDFPADWDSIRQLIIVFAAPDSWGDLSGPSPTMGYGDRWLVTKQTEEAHGQIDSFLNQLKRHLSGAAASPPSPHERKPQEINEALERTIQLDFDQAALKDAVLALQTELKIPIILSAKKLEEAGVSPDFNVTAPVGEAKARDYLDAILRPLELTFLLRDEVVQITTPEDSEGQRETRVYDPRPLLKRGLIRQELQDLVVAKVQPKSWVYDGGPGQLNFYAELLVIVQTDRAHEQIAAFLAHLAETIPARRDAPQGEQP